MPTTGKVYLGSTLVCDGAGGGFTPPPAMHLLPEDWTRPDYWPAMSDPPPGTQQIKILMRVDPPVPGGSTDVSTIRLDAEGPWDVDWGDGTSESNLTLATTKTMSWAGATSVALDINSAVAGVEYWIEDLGDTPEADWNALAGTSGVAYKRGFSLKAAVNGSTLSNTTGTISRAPYRFAIITITPNGAGNLTDFISNYDANHIEMGNMLEVVIRAPFLTTWNALPSGYVNEYTCLHVKILEHSLTALSLSSIAGLECFEINNSGIEITDWNSAFLNTNLRYLTPLDLSGATNLNSTFRGSLIDGYPSFTANSATTISSMFQSCTCLRALGDITANSATASATLLTSSGALASVGNISLPLSTSPLTFPTSIVTVGDLYIPSVTSLNSMFYNCESLRSVGTITATAATTATSLFEFAGLTEVGDINLPAATNCVSLFESCETLQTVGNINIPAATNISRMFTSCSALTSVGNITTSSALVTVSNLFSGCESMIDFPTLSNVSNASDWSYAFNNCESMIEAPAWVDTSAATSTVGMFQSCKSIRRAPYLNTPNVQSMVWMFRYCSSLIDVPIYDMSSCTTVDDIFDGCHSLKAIPAFDMQNVTTILQLTPSQAATISACHVIHAYNQKATFSIANNKFQAEALNYLYTNLADVTALGARTLTVSGNPGVTGDDPSIATAKGWTVSG